MREPDLKKTDSSNRFLSEISRISEIFPSLIALILSIAGRIFDIRVIPISLRIRSLLRFFSLCTALLLLFSPAFACTTFIVTKGASADGSVYVGHTNDGYGPGIVYDHVAGEMTQLVSVPAADHPPGSVRAVRYDPNSGGDGPEPGPANESHATAYIPQVNHTYAYYTGAYAIMNEHQVMFGECTDLTKIQPSFDQKRRILYSSELSNIAAERATTAREAVTIIGNLIDTYGYYGTGETLPVADPNEAWVIEMTSGSENGTGGLWAAQRVPDGTVFVAANTFRIREIDPAGPDFLYSKNLFSVAEANGWWSQDMGRLDWLRATSAGEYSHPYYSLARVWSLYHRIAPSQNFSPYVTDTYSRDYPFSVRPDHPLSTPEIFGLFRDHYEGTVFDLTTGEAAGPFGNPYRWRGPFDDHEQISPGEVKPGAWPRPVSEMYSGYSYVTQGRSSLPDPVGGVAWLGFGSASETVYVPFYAGGTDTPASFRNTNRSEFSRDSAWRAFDLTASWATLNYRLMSREIKNEQAALESAELARQPAIEQEAATLCTKGNDAACHAFLTNYSMTTGNAAVAAWWNLSDRLVVEYSNNLVYHPDTGRDEFAGYPDWWLDKAGYQYGPRVYDIEELSRQPDLLYTNKTVQAEPGRELSAIRSQE